MFHLFICMFVWLFIYDVHGHMYQETRLWVRGQFCGVRSLDHSSVDCGDESQVSMITWQLPSPAEPSP